MIPFMGVFAENRQDTLIVVTDTAAVIVAPQTITSSGPGSLAKGGNVIDATLSMGMSFGSLSRGLLGMCVILVVAWIFSKNRKSINWRVVIIGLSIQVILAIGILYIPFIRYSFEFVGKIFVKILDFTKEGSTFLFGGLMNMESFGMIFAFQILPTIKIGRAHV